MIIDSRRGLSNVMCHRNQPNKTKIVLYKLLLSLSSHLKQFYISNKTESFSYKDILNVSIHVWHTCIETLKEEQAWGIASKGVWRGVSGVSGNPL